MKTKLIANPTAGKQQLTDLWLKKIHPFLKTTLPPFDFEFTRHKNHATEITRVSLQEGYELIIAMGGDGTLNEVLNGFFAEGRPINKDASLAVLPFGSGSDFCRSLSLPRNYRKAASHIVSGKTEWIDVGRVSFENSRFPPRYFINIAEAGAGATVVKCVNALNKSIPPVLRYLAGTIQGFAKYKNQKITLTGDDQTFSDINLTNLVVANGRFCGHGMLLAPNARLDDGLFDVVIFKDLNLLKFIRRFPQLYTKNKTWETELCTAFRAKNVHIVNCENESLLETETDGDAVGLGPANFTLLPRALKIRI